MVNHSLLETLNDSTWTASTLGLTGVILGHFMSGRRSSMAVGSRLNGPSVTETVARLAVAELLRCKPTSRNGVVGLSCPSSIANCVKAASKRSENRQTLRIPDPPIETYASRAWTPTVASIPLRDTDFPRRWPVPRSLRASGTDRSTVLKRLDEPDGRRQVCRGATATAAAAATAAGSVFFFFTRLSARALRRRDLHLRVGPVPGLDRLPQAPATGRGHHADPCGERILAGGLRWAGLRLQRAVRWFYTEPRAPPSWLWSSRQPEQTHRRNRPVRERSGLLHCRFR